MLIALRRSGVFIFFTALLVLGGTVAKADPAREVVGLFVQSCLKYVESPADLMDWIDSVPQLRKLSPRQSQQFLAGRRGTVWSASNDAGLFALTVYDDDSCSVMGQRANATEVSQVFSEYLRRKNLPVDKIGDQTKYNRGIDQREEIYRSRGAGMLYEVVLVTSKSQRADAQAVLTTRPNR